MHAWPAMVSRISSLISRRRSPRRVFHQERPDERLKQFLIFRRQEVNIADSSPDDGAPLDRIAAPSNVCGGFL